MNSNVGTMSGSAKIITNASGLIGFVMDLRIVQTDQTKKNAAFSLKIGYKLFFFN